LRKIINDPVHGFITITDPLILEIISHPYFIRLSRIKQMAMAYVVYPGAVHTRFHHSLGAYHLMSLALDELKQKGEHISIAEEQAAKLAILLHDAGHGPFSHALEATLVNVHHEEISLLIMQEFNQLFDGKLAMAIEIFLNKHPKKFLHQLVSSQLDVDRLDYLARDSFFTGVSEGVIGYDRIIKMLTVHNIELAVEEKGVHSIEKFLIARRLMYWQVYLHKTVLSSELMLVKILERAKFLVSQGETLFASPAFLFFLENNFSKEQFNKDPTCLQHFIQLDDTDILGAIKVWCHHQDSILSQLSNRLINRKLLKTIFSAQENPEELQSIQNQVQTQFNLEAADIHYFVYANSVTNRAYDPSKQSIEIVCKNQEVTNIANMGNSLIVSAVGEEVKKYYICYPTE
jgi:uncharacterized protein